jgi:hypothetical protein
MGLFPYGAIMPNTEKIRELNDQFRTTLCGGKVMVTRGISERPDLALIMEQVRTFNRFNEDCDPFKEHDFGSLKVGSDQIFWKIDYYAPDMESGSPDPANPSITRRVLTVMLSGEY